MPKLALIRMPHAYELKDFAPLRPYAQLYEVREIAELGQPDAIFLPGSSDVAADFDALVQSGLADPLKYFAAQLVFLFCRCRGLQLMGRSLPHPQHHKYPFAHKVMLGLLQLDTYFEEEMLLASLKGVRAPWGCTLRGFESHRGHSKGEEPPLFFHPDGSPLGYGHGQLMGTYLHRCFHNKDFVRALCDALPNR